PACAPGLLASCTHCIIHLIPLLCSVYPVSKQHPQPLPPPEPTRLTSYRLRLLLCWSLPALAASIPAGCPVHSPQSATRRAKGIKWSRVTACGRIHRPRSWSCRTSTPTISSLRHSKCGRNNDPSH
ncbi:hypothetical protein CLAIMM_10023 isoform 1, partial [Cladophialophora immunda]